MSFLLGHSVECIVTWATSRKTHLITLPIIWPFRSLPSHSWDNLKLYYRKVCTIINFSIDIMTTLWKSWGLVHWDFLVSCRVISVSITLKCISDFLRLNKQLLNKLWPFNRRNPPEVLAVIAPQRVWLWPQLSRANRSSRTGLAKRNCRRRTEVQGIRSSQQRTPRGQKPCGY